MELRGLAATQRLAESIAAVLRPGDVLGLDGDLGAGKTTFVRFLARALGVTTPVTSPTFTLANTYEAPQWPDRSQPLVIHHIDAYRLEGDADAEDLALAELLDSGGIVVVEWAERLTLPADRLDLHFAYPPELLPTAPPSPATTAPVTPAGLTAATPGALITEPELPDTTAPDAPDATAPDATAPDATDHRIATIAPHGDGWHARPIALDGPAPLRQSSAVAEP